MDLLPTHAAFAQCLYAAAYGAFPFNSFLAALASSLGQTVLLITLRSYIHYDAFDASTITSITFGDFLCSSMVLQVLVAALLM